MIKLTHATKLKETALQRLVHKINQGENLQTLDSILPLVKITNLTYALYMDQANHQLFFEPLTEEDLENAAEWGSEG